MSKIPQIFRSQVGNLILNYGVVYFVVVIYNTSGIVSCRSESEYTFVCNS